MVYKQKGRFQEAVIERQKSANLCEDTHGEKLWLAHAYALAGQSGDVRRILADVETTSRLNAVRLPYLALVHLSLGDKELARELLKEAIERHAMWAGALRAPTYDPFVKGGDVRGPFARRGCCSNKQRVFEILLATVPNGRVSGIFRPGPRLYAVAGRKPSSNRQPVGKYAGTITVFV